ncbi:hypothetical protein [Streptacidiphilus sp. EB129]|jgi:hypothetical protein|uniref:hypothetical protein n=1 Tax=Streptacidiphilus sp. EB129 TaxID=3156262 RepID=UPI003514D17B
MRSIRIVAVVLGLGLAFPFVTTFAAGAAVKPSTTVVRASGVSPNTVCPLSMTWDGSGCV